MKERVALVFVFLSLFAWTNAVSQDNPPAESPSPGGNADSLPAIIDASGTSPYEKGDGMLSLRVGATFDVALYGFASASFLPENVKPGLDFSISYLHFLNGSFALGGEAGGSFNGTLAKRSLFVAPILFRTAWMFVRMPFEIMPNAGLGISLTSLGDKRHIDPTLKLGTTFFWRANQDASYGINLDALIIGQFYSDPSNNCLSLFLETGLVAVYHL